MVVDKALNRKKLERYREGDRLEYEMIV